jgi:hypothetical protein
MRIVEIHLVLIPSGIDPYPKNGSVLSCPENRREFFVHEVGITVSHSLRWKYYARLRLGQYPLRCDATGGEVPVQFQSPGQPKLGGRNPSQAGYGHRSSRGENCVPAE